MKLIMFISIVIGGLIGGWLGIKLDGGFGLWSFLLGGFVGPIIGVFVGYNASKEWLE